MIMKTTKGTWKIFGMNLISSDEIYKKIKKAIETGEGLTEKALQKATGHLLPISIEPLERTITFAKF